MAASAANKKKTTKKKTTKKTTGRKSSTALSKPPASGKPTTRKADHRQIRKDKGAEALDKQIRDTWRTFETVNTKLFAQIEEADQRKLYASYEFKSMSDYLQQHVGMEVRHSQYLVGTVRAFRGVGMSGSDFEALGPTASREIARFVKGLTKKGKLEPKTVSALVSRHRKGKWSTDRLSEEINKELSRHDVSKGGDERSSDGEVRLRRSFKASESEWAAIQELASQVATDAGTQELAACIEFGLANCAAGVTDDPVSALRQGGDFLKTTVVAFDRAAKASISLSSGNATEQRRSSKLRSDVGDLAANGIMSLADYISPEDIDSDSIRKKLSKGGPTNLLDRSEMILQVVAELAELDEEDLQPVLDSISAKRDAVRKSG